jgi:uncharacterized protein (UPF0548 family)
MFLVRHPSDQRIRSFISAQQQSQLSYNPSGLTRDSLPAGYNVDHNRVRLGTGVECFNAAVAAITQWKMFDLGWVRLCWDDTPIEPGANVAIVVHHLGFWSINACRIVYVIDEPGRYGFAYGTLAQHAEIGEERFMVEWNRQDDSIWYDILAVSKPGPLARFGYPYARRLQKRFARDSKRAIQRAVLQ